MGETTTTAAGAMPEALGTTVTFVVDSVVDMITLVTANPVLCLGVAAWCVGLAIALFKRLV